jgi:DNA polymerase elongation subunit (family B)
MKKYYTNVNRWGNTLFVRGIKNGKEFKDKFNYSPTLYLESPKPTGITSIYGANLKPIEFNKMQEASDFARQHQDTNLKVYGFPLFHSTYINETFPNAEKDFNRDEIRTFNIDIEVTSNEGFPTAKEAAYPITAICIHDNITDKYITLGDNDWDKEKSELSSDLTDKVIYVKCNSEHDLLTKFLKIWTDNCPNVVTGWNVSGFDMPYIYNRLTNLGFDAGKLSPWGRVDLRDYNTRMGVETEVAMKGVSVIDYIVLYRRNKIQESYRLDWVAYLELGQRKLDHSEVTGLHTLYYSNYQKFIDYNIQDVNLVRMLDEKLGLIDAQLAMAYKASLNYDEVSSPVRAWDSLINKELIKGNQHPHYNITAGDKSVQIPGGHVKEPIVGKHGWVLSFDLNSLYPHLIMQYNISPETILKSGKIWPNESAEERIQRFLRREPIPVTNDSTIICPSGWQFSNKIEGIIPKIMRTLYEERKEFKDRMIAKQKAGKSYSYEHNNQQVRKILLNSGYGAITNKFYRWYDQRLGESITLSGQFIIQEAEKNLNAFMNKLLKTVNKDYVIAIDTDSNYLNVQPIIDKFFSDKTSTEIVDILDKIAEEQIDKVLEKGFTEVSEYQNTLGQKMIMKRECIAETAFWTAKKRYAMAVWDTEGFRHKEIKIKVQGLDAIRSSTPQIMREKLLKMVNLTLTDTEENLQKYVAGVKAEYLSMVPQDIAFPRTMNSITDYTIGIGFMKGTPPHVRGAIAFNRLLDEKKLTGSWEKVKNGEKGRFIYLREPNNVGTYVISFMTSIPDEIDIIKYIDYEKMFNKTVTEPLKHILDPIGWSSVKRATLVDFFS